MVDFIDSKSRKAISIGISALLCCGVCFSMVGCGSSGSGDNQQPAQISAPSDTSDDEKPTVIAKPEKTTGIESPKRGNTGFDQYYNFNEAYGSFMDQYDVTEFQKEVTEAVKARENDPNSPVQCYKETEFDETTGITTAYFSVPQRVEYFKFTYDQTKNIGDRIKITFVEDTETLPSFAADEGGNG